MASERQIAANRLNARKSTGPRSRAGKQRASRNAYRHGLSASVVAKQIDDLAHQIVGEGEDGVCLQLARSVAEAHLELARIRQTKVALIERIRSCGAFEPGPEFLLPRRQCLRLLKEMLAGRQPQPVPSRKFTDAIKLRVPPAIRGEPEASAEAFRRILRQLIKIERYERRAPHGSITQFGS